MSIIPASQFAINGLSHAEYQQKYQESITNSDKFWGLEANRLHWFRPWHTVKNATFSPAPDIKWFEGGSLNACYNCVDRHLPHKAETTAIIWESDDGKSSQHITYSALYDHVCRFANILKKNGAKKGDRIIIYMPMIPEAVYAMLACARIGAIHSVVFGGFSPESIKSRIVDCSASIVITADEGRRGGKTVPLKANIDEALNCAETSSIKKVIVVRSTGGTIDWNNERDIWYHNELNTIDAVCEAEPMASEDPLFILYTSGSTGKPKGIMHTTAGYLLYAAITHEYVFNIKPNDIYWCTADIGWITGHSYVVYGPLCNGATTMIFEGVPTHPTPARIWQVVDKHQVSILYTAPTLIRTLMHNGEEYVKSSSRKSLRILGSVGEPINPEAWLWFFKNGADEQSPVIDTWWQTETGGIMIAPLPSATNLKPGSATLPFFGIEPVIVDSEGRIMHGECEGNLCIAAPHPGIARTIYGDAERYQQTYFSTYKGMYFTGDGARRDADGYYWITGRVDDVINVSGHRLGTAEIESALVAHELVSEAAVVGFPHDIKGHGIYAYVTLIADAEKSDALKAELKQFVRKQIGALAQPDVIHWADQLPKTRSGKIMRRILRKISAGEIDSLGDTSTLLNPDSVGTLIAGM